MDGRDPGGGSRQLVRLIDKYGEYLVPDFLSHYQVDLRELVSDDGDLSPRRALVLLMGLPFGCRSWAYIQDEPDLQGWDPQAYLLAALVDSVRENTFATVQIQTKKKLKAPEPMKIPGVRKKEEPKGNLFVQMARAHYQAGKEKTWQTQEGTK